SLHVTGSLANHTVRLEASPPLTEQQIVALLLVGSTEESLSMVMPTLIMNNITNLLFGKDQANVHDYFKNMLRPFKYIHLVPSFTDHTGRGGLRGAVEIDVNDRWHALVQKNFSLSEDTRVEVEYMMSDDVSLRGIRDERRDLGAEVEMKWKF
ncbi:MAG TPA: translocation/assembly module TamB domain-containing protein, partial [Candidatus Limnocylindria bacterium]|nr:translocation/assembly module TamB domain-containing protein [Candidatus Limnocylindria bacterium]